VGLGLSGSPGITEESPGKSEGDYFSR